MLRRDKMLLESLTGKYGKEYILNEISKSVIRKTINKYDSLGGRKTQLSRIKDSMRNIIEVEDERENWYIVTEYNAIYVLDESSFLKVKDLKKIDDKFEYNYGIWVFNIELNDWRNSNGDYMFPLTTNRRLAKALAKAVEKALDDNFYSANDNEPVVDEDGELVDESLVLHRNVDYTNPDIYLAQRMKEFDFLDRDGYIGYVKYYAYGNDYMLMWYPANKPTVSTTPYAFDIQNGVWINEKPEFIKDEQEKARELAKYIAEVAPRAEKRFKDWHTYLA